jgi:hypothetical protein
MICFEDFLNALRLLIGSTNEVENIDIGDS